MNIIRSSNGRLTLERRTELPEDPPIYDALARLITTDDGTILRCVPKETTGLHHPKRTFWSVTAANGVTYFGPPYAKAHSVDEVREMVNEWWAIKKAAGHVGVNAFAMRLMIDNGVSDREN